MKTRSCLAVISATLILASCSMSQKSGNETYLNSRKLLVKQELGACTESANKPPNSILSIPDHFTNYENKKSVNILTSIEKPKPLAGQILTEHKNDRLIFVNQPGNCDLIILNGGDQIQSKVLEINEYAIKYKKCENIEGPTYTISKNKVKEIKYSNGSNDIISHNNNSNNDYSNTYNKPERNNGYIERNLEGFGMAGFLLGMLGLILCFVQVSLGILVAIPLLALFAIIFGAVGMGRVSNNPDELMGKGFGITALILGILEMIIVLILIIAVAVLI